MDEAKLHEFMGKLVSDMGGAAMMASVIVGEELGLYRAMADSIPITPEELASKTGCNARLLREWLSAHAAAGYMEHAEALSFAARAGPGAGGRGFARLRRGRRRGISGAVPR